MSDKYKATDDSAYFITITIVEWIDVFTRLKQRQDFIESLRYCQENKGLIIYAYCLMLNHVHLICQAEEENMLSSIIRDLKKHTSRQIIKNIEQETDSRKEWILSTFKKSCEHLKRKQQHKVWQNGYHAELISSNKFLYQKIDYIHMNPVEEGLVDEPEDYRFSSARNYAGLQSELEIEQISSELKTY